MTADACGWALENWLGYLWNGASQRHSESQGIGRIPSHETSAPPWVQFPILCLDNGPVPPTLIKDLQTRVHGADGRKGVAVPPKWSAPPSRGPAPTRRQKMESNLVSSISQQMLGTIRINGLETQVRAIQKLLITSKTAPYGGEG